ncbi:MAG: hydroxyethylthiazole kinase [Firmicutes bacterium]|nr:hydroxyethylthiazole kinase [Bacillota bacterium]
MNAGEICARLLEDVRGARPLVHNITNWVVTNVTANITLAIGASPVMAHAAEEVEDMVRFAGALVLNIGTLTPDIVDAMVLAGKRANALGIPVVLDPVGAGATPLRTESARRILSEVRVSVLRGNAAEIGILGGFGGDIKGVDSRSGAKDPRLLAADVAKSFDCVTAVTGKTDYISDGKVVLTVDNGHEMLTRVTGTGCMATSVIGAFASVTKDYAWASAAALACYGIAAEIAAENSRGPGSFQAALFDAVYNLTPALVRERARVAVAG